MDKLSTPWYTVEFHILPGYWLNYWWLEKEENILLKKYVSTCACTNLKIFRKFNWEILNYYGKINNACLLVKIMPRVNIICEIKLKNLIQFFFFTIKNLGIVLTFIIYVVFNRHFYMENLSSSNILTISHCVSSLNMLVPYTVWK